MEKFADGIRRTNASTNQALNMSTRRNMHQSVDEEEGNVPQEVIESNHFLDLLSERDSKEEAEHEDELDQMKIRLDIDDFNPSTNRL
jgi:hypothetical protein